MIVMWLAPNGKVMVSSTDSPYFCLEADTEAGVLEKLKRANEFLNKVSPWLQLPPKAASTRETN